MRPRNNILEIRQNEFIHWPNVRVHFYLCYILLANYSTQFLLKTTNVNKFPKVFTSLAKFCIIARGNHWYLISQSSFKKKKNPAHVRRIHSRRKRIEYLFPFIVSFWLEWSLITCLDSAFHPTTRFHLNRSCLHFCFGISRGRRRVFR